MSVPANPSLWTSPFLPDLEAIAAFLQTYDNLLLSFCYICLRYFSRRPGILRQILILIALLALGYPSLLIPPAPTASRSFATAHCREML